MGIKYYLNIFFVLFRLLFLQRHAVEVPVGCNPTTGCYPFTIESFHVEAGVDDFHMLGMYFDVPAGCLLEYKHSYSGYYNNVSQCVYRHFPSYKRRIPTSLEDASLPNASDLSILPALKQIYPEIEFAFEDHHFQRDVCGAGIPVLLAPGRSHTQKLVCRDRVPTNNRPLPQVVGKKPSENIQARIAACSGGTSADSGSGADSVPGVIEAATGAEYRSGEQGSLHSDVRGRRKRRASFLPCEHSERKALLTRRRRAL
ncbi:hypothetical protein T484DRAFT_3639284 [Baffinella frigidus]|nr:hypothetical protein T484DRAFT_3639284 [Cryptophyta sp. CCMP2293]